MADTPNPEEPELEAGRKAGSSWGWLLACLGIFVLFLVAIGGMGYLYQRLYPTVTPLPPVTLPPNQSMVPASSERATP